MIPYTNDPAERAMDIAERASKDFALHNWFKRLLETYDTILKEMLYDTTLQATSGKDDRGRTPTSFKSRRTLCPVRTTLTTWEIALRKMRNAAKRQAKQAKEKYGLQEELSLYG